MSEEMNLNDTNEFKEGELVKATVAQVDEKSIIVTIEGAPYDGIVPISELSSLHIEKASDSVSIGDELELMITKVEETNFVLSKRRVDAEKAWDKLEQQFQSGEIIETEVKEVVKGGLVVDLGVRGFIPASLIEDHFVESFEDYKGKVITFKIVEIEKDKNRLILSHKAVVEDEKSVSKQQTFESIKSGDILTGTVQRLASFGAFVDIGGVDGLVHISQISYEHLENIADVLKEGQEVKVKVLSIDRDAERISLSIKDTLPGPWAEVEEKASKGAVLTGKVKRLVSYGAFVEVFPGVEGLVHISQIAHKHISNPQEVLKEGEEVQVKVIEVNLADKRLSLSIKELVENEDKYNIEDYQMPEESRGFSISDVLGDKLKGFTNNN
ncbi:30S ribosomal protein S1 [Psychrobacillus psychrodurans]|jgi:small subunit ribosomal protein S1|uniref:30S ribosomal protein S1 n=1 Tax=Psychrobacillus TaxID=1221880 RepID=UPI0008E5CA84|nr:30S ribosomal protein S1 [Psychrobacillus psychrodurans]MCK1998056.1 30S ribosomal protein S1 [Psychrobacillus psychrodurans]MCZ8540115.1 30S ribosomal protein S1 [Psychrobacillus psychrodurans]SFM49798.1 small subunit ribosomal protein S1 [Psychrobacillus psychrodurans]